VGDVARPSDQVRSERWLEGSAVAPRRRSWRLWKGVGLSGERGQTA
jgi:hypothetical protein